MKLETDKRMVVFNGDLKSIAIIEAGEYEVRKIKPLDKENRKATWYKIMNTTHIFALNRRKVPEGLVLKGFFYNLKNLLRRKQKFSFLALISFHRTMNFAQLVVSLDTGKKLKGVIIPYYSAPRSSLAKSNIASFIF